MSEEIKATEQTSVPAAEPEQSTAAALSRKRRVALVTYLSILFAVAFLLVAASMVIENRQLQSSNAALKNDSQKTSANLNRTIQEMQNEFDALKQQSESQAAQIDALTAQAEQQQAEAESRYAALESEAAEASAAAESQAAALQSELAEARIAAESQAAELTKRAEDAVTVSELLQKAIAANEEGDLEAVGKYREQIEPLKDLLSPSELDWYESLAVD